MTHVASAIVATKTIILLLGGLITFLSFKAYRRTRAKALRSLAAGFGVITAGSILAGIVDVFLQVNLEYSILVQSLMTAVGFVIITYSLYAE